MINLRRDNPRNRNNKRRKKKYGSDINHEKAGKGLSISIAVLVVIFIVVAIWTWNNLEDTEKYKKIIFIIVGLIISYIITLIIFSISKNGVQYQNHESEVAVQNMLVVIFTSINSLILLPYYAKTYKKLEKKEIKKYQFQRKILIIVIGIIECGYLKDTQKGILKIYESRVEERY